MAQVDQLRILLEKKNALLKCNEELAEKQHASGKRTARERVEKICDSGSFVEIQSLQTEAAVITGYALIGQRPVYVIAQDVTTKGAAMSDAQAAKMIRTLDMAEKIGAPVLFFADSEGVCVKEGAVAMAAYARVFARMARLSGICPIITLVCGPCMGIAAHFAQLADIAIAVEKTGLIMPVSPLVMNATAGKQLKDEEMGGAVAAAKQGTVAMTAADEKQAYGMIKALIDLLPSSNEESAPFVENDNINRLMTAGAEDGFALAQDLADAGSVNELYRHYGQGCHTLLARIGGQSCGIIASEPREEGGRMDIAALKKAARLVRFCDCYRLPVITLLNSEGLAVPSVQNQGEAMRASSQLLYAYAEATTPKLAVLTGNAIGAAYVAMAGSAADLTYAWPEAMVAPLTREAAVQTFDAEKLKTEERAVLEENYARSSDGLNLAAAGLADDVIDPAETRKYLIAALELMYTKSEAAPAREHGNMPL